MVSIELSESITEILDVLKHMEKKYIDKIPKNFKDFLYKNKSETYKPELDYSKTLNNMNLKEKTKDILAVIYMKYWCDSEQKLNYMKVLENNEVSASFSKHLIFYDTHLISSFNYLLPYLHHTFLENFMKI